MSRDKRSLTFAAIVLVVSLAVWACGRQGPTATSSTQSNSTQSSTSASGELHFKAPDGWVTEKASSSMRVAQYKLPKAEGDNDDASLIVYYFGATQGGTTQANIDRWIAQMITEKVRVPTVGIGAGVHCDIQVLVFHDLVGMAFGKLPRFVREYANLRETITDAVTRWAEDVRNGTYPSEQESYGLPAEAAEELNIEIKKVKT